MYSLLRALLPVIALIFHVGIVCAANIGQADLDKATDTKLTASTISDLSEVIRLCESALKKGLDQSNVDFANKLLVSTLIQRAQATFKQILAGTNSAEDFQLKRQFALSDIEKAVKLDPKQADAYALIAQLHVLPGGERKQAREAIDKALQLGFEQPLARAKALLLRADLQEQFEKKLADLNEAVRLMPNDANMLRTRGRFLAQSNKLDAALADFKKAIALEPEDGYTYEAKGVVLLLLKKYEDALAAFDKARLLNPRSVSPWIQRARVHSEQQKPDAVLEDLNEALITDPNNVTVLLMRSAAHQEKGDKEKALADVDEALKLQPKLTTAIRSRAVLLADSRRFDEAVGELEKLRKLNPKDTLTLLQLAIVYSAQKKTAKAINSYAALLAADANDWRALRGRGDLYLNIGKQAEAIADYEKALKLQPKDHAILNNLAWALATSPDDKLRNGKRAVELATSACEETKYKLAHILSTLAAAYAETGDFQNAIKWSSKAVEVGDKEHGDQLKKELESYQAKKPWRELLSEDKPPEKSAGQPEKKP